MRIRKWPINCCTFSLNIHKIIPSVDYNQWLKHLDTQIDEPTNQNSIKIPQSFRANDKKCYFKTLGTNVRNSQSPLPP